MLEIFILRKIRIRERYGGELVNLAQKHVDSEIKVPTIYAMLRRHTRDNILEIMELRDKDGVTRGTSRKYYQLTELGSDYLELIEDEIDIMSDYIDPKEENKNE